tara:strand:+ start:712 stop:1551 length:840 start_codon:yes stop_codon:yes gene_type:complete
MPILLLSDEAQASINASLRSDRGQRQMEDVLGSNRAVVALLSAAMIILRQEKFVQIKGFPVLDDSAWKFFSEHFGVYAGAVERTDIKVDCTYTGCAINPLTLHNDDAIDLERQPEYGFIQVTTADRCGPVSNGVVLARELVRKLKFEDPDLLQKLISLPIPMLSYGINHESASKREIIIDTPIIYKDVDGEYCLRFDLERNSHYYREKKKSQPLEEGMMIYQFLRHASVLKKKVLLSVGDILVLDNKRTLHDREECTICFNLDGTTQTRSIAVSFSRRL